MKRKSSRKLELKAESLIRLGDTQLHNVAGGAEPEISVVTGPCGTSHTTRFGTGG